MMRKFILATAFLLATYSLFAQNTTDQGKPILKIFANYHQGLSQEVSNETAFEILRAYLGWEQHLNENWKAVLKLDIGSPDDLSQYSLIRRYAYFKNAYVQYQKEKINIGVGLVDMLHIGYPEKQWAHRYIMKEFQDQYKFAPKADIGVFGQFALSDKISVDAVLVNGEGYKNLQRDNVYKYGAGFTVKPFDGLSARFHYDITPKEIIQHSFSGFIGYNFNKKFSIGFDGAYQMNHSFGMDQDLFGFSAFGYYALNNRWEAFVRYDKLNSNIIDGETAPWNLAKDGTSLIGGIQYQMSGFLKFALSYQDWYDYAANGTNKSYIYLNMEVSF